MRARSAAPFCLAFVLGCSAEPRGVATMKVAVPPSPAPSAVGTATRLDVELFSPLLSAPELRTAAEALEAGDAARAAVAVESVLKGRPPDDKTRSFDFLLGRLREAAMDFPGAATAYEAAAAPTWALSGYAWLAEGRALRLAGRSSEALSVLRKVPADQPIHEDARLESAEAALALGDSSLALVVWREHLAKENASDDVIPLSLRLGELLVARALAAPPGDPGVPAAGREALSLARRALARVTEPVQTARARALEARALSMLPEPERTAHALPSPEEDLERLAALVDAKQFLDAVPLANGLVAALGSVATQQSCAAWLLRARALAGVHDLRGAETAAADVGQKCEDVDDRAQGLFLAGKYATEDKRFADAIRHYEMLEASCPGNRLADDARLKRALCCKELGADDRFTELLTRMPDDYPSGDMVLDGMFALATFRIEKGDWASAATVLERATSMAEPNDTKRGQEFAGRERYFRARAWGELGEREKSLAEYEGIIRELPLSYYMLHAYSRLAAVDAPRAARALEDAEKRSAAEAFTFARIPAFDSPGFRRALELLRVGDVANASRGNGRARRAEGNDAAADPLGRRTALRARRRGEALSRCHRRPVDGLARTLALRRLVPRMAGRISEAVSRRGQSRSEA